MLTVFNSSASLAQKPPQCLRHSVVPNSNTPLHRFFYEDDCGLKQKLYVKGFLASFPYSKEGAPKEYVACSQDCSLILGEMGRAEQSLIQSVRASQTKRIKITQEEQARINNLSAQINNLYNQYTVCCRDCRTGKACW